MNKAPCLKGCTHHEAHEGHEGSGRFSFINFVIFASSLESTGRRYFGHFKQSLLDRVIPAWSAGIQIDTDVSASILANLDAGYPCRHDEVCNFIVCEQV